MSELAIPEVPTDTPATAIDALLTARYQGLVSAWTAQEAASIAETKAAADDARTRGIASQSAEIAESKARADDDRSRAATVLAANIALEKAEFDSEYELMKEFHEAIVEVAKGALDRAKATGQFVQAAASAVATIYTGILAFLVVAANKTLPVRGIIPDVFLGLAIALSVGYLAFMSRGASVSGPGLQPSRRAYQIARTAAFVRYVNGAVLSRSGLLRASVISLASGALFLPIGLVEVGTWEPVVWMLAVFALIVVFVSVPVLDWYFDRDRKGSDH